MPNLVEKVVQAILDKIQSQENELRTIVKICIGLTAEWDKTMANTHIRFKIQDHRYRSEFKSQNKYMVALLLALKAKLLKGREEQI